MIRSLARLIGVLAVCAAVSSPALARGRHHHRHHGHHAHRHHAASIGAPMQLSGARMLVAASRFVGSRNPTGFHAAWCGAFAAMIARRVGARVPRGATLARNWASAGHATSPHVGALAVFLHHVTIIAKIVPGGFYGLGGNQGHMVRLSHFSWRGVIAIRSV